MGTLGTLYISRKLSASLLILPATFKCNGLGTLLSCSCRVVLY